MALLLFPLVAEATERWFEGWSEADGMPTQDVLGVAQDDQGAIWLASLMGPMRYDGHRFTLNDPIPVPTRTIRFGPSGGLVVPRYRQDPLHWLGGEVVRGPDGEPMVSVRDAREHRGRLWVAHGPAVRVREDGAWRTVLEIDDNVQTLAFAGDEVVALSAEGAWQIQPGPPRKIWDGGGITAWVRFGGRTIVATLDGRVLALENGEVEVIAEGLGYPSNAVLRNDALWVAMESGLVRLDATGQADVVRLPTVGSIGQVFVDREGSLWVAGSRGVVRFPEPDTQLWTEADGLPGVPVDGLVPDGDRLWVRGRMAPYLWEDGAIRPVSLVRKPAAICKDAQGQIWSGGLHPESGFIVVRGLGAESEVFSWEEEFRGCASGPGGLFLASSSTFYRVGSPPVPIGPVPSDAFGWLFSLGPDAFGWLDHEQLCRNGHPDEPGGWTCEPTPIGFDEVVHDTWAIGDHQIWIRDEAGWRKVPAGVRATDIAASPRGGLWVLGLGVARRIDSEGAVIERLGTAHGLFDRSPTSIYESPDGTIWFGSRTGLTRIPASARARELPIPEVVLAEVSVDGALREERGSMALEWDESQLVVRLNALSFLDPQKLLYRLSVNGQERHSVDGVFGFVDLKPGHYVLSATVSAGGTRWSVPATLTVDVAHPPWWSWWALTSYVLAVGGVLTVGYRARVAYLLGLERQRVRIALDLHDEVGSGLGSIGLIATSLPLLDDPAKAAQTIAETSAELGEVLTDIVWALREDSDLARELLTFLEGRGRNMFADGSVQFEVVSEGVRATRFSLPVRRTVSGIILEAMHNAAKYAKPTRVELGLRAGHPWMVWVRDDGGGIDPEAPIRPGGGSGLAGMRRRAKQIGAQLSIASGPDGTTVSLCFEPDATDRRIR